MRAVARQGKQENRSRVGGTVRRPARRLNRNLQPTGLTPRIQRTPGCACGGGCPRCQEEGPALQAKLKVNQPGDRYEREAERVAERVMRLPERSGSDGRTFLIRGLNSSRHAPSAMMAPLQVEEEEPAALIQRRSIEAYSDPRAGREEAEPGGREQNAPSRPTDRGSIRFAPEHSQGKPLSPRAREFFEPRFGASFEGVRVHTDRAASQAARSVRARAFTVGKSIFFNEGEYQPDSPRGQRLLAHELTHTIQQRGAGKHPSSIGLSAVKLDPISRLDSRLGLVQRNGDNGDPSPPDAGLPGGVPVPEPEPAPSPQPGESSAGLQDVGSDVVVVLISCADSLINFRSPTENYTYRLTSCEIPTGTYETTVTVHGDEVEWDFGRAVPEGEVFRFSYAIEAGQENPATLFDTGDRSTVQVVPSLQTTPPESAPAGCALSFSDRTVIDSARLDPPLEIFPEFTREFTLWSHTIPLGKFGWVEVTLEANVNASGIIEAYTDAGRLRDICIMQRIDDRRLGGSARFTYGASVEPSLHLGGGLDFEARYLSIIPALSASGNLNADAGARFRAELNAPISVIYDHVDRSWEMTAQAVLSGSASFMFQLTADALIEVLGADVWSENWELINESVDFGWAGGVRVGPELLPPQIEWDTGRLGQPGVLSAPNGGAASGGGSSSGLNVDEAVEALSPLLDLLLEHDPDNVEAEEISVTGRTRQDPIPMIWYKPASAYPRSIILPDEEVFRFGDPPRDYVLPNPEVVRRGRGAADLRRMPSYQESGVITFGVDPDNIPTDQRIQDFDPGLVWKKTRSYRTALGQGPQRALRFFLRSHGYDLTGLDADHVKDLQFEGSDDFDNLWPLRSSVNQSSREFARQLVRYNDEQGTVHETTLDDSSLRGRWFRIVGTNFF